MEQTIQIAAICVIAAVLALLLRKSNPEVALVLSIAAAVVALLFLSQGLQSLTEYLAKLTERSGVSSDLFIPLYKTIGIALVVRVGGDLCRDAGESALAATIETAGTICALVVALPLFTKVLDLLSGLMQ